MEKVLFFVRAVARREAGIAHLQSMGGFCWVKRGERCAAITWISSATLGAERDYCDQ